MSKKNAIVVLTRGYKDNHNYDNLINRNKNIYKYIWKPELDVIIFHEGNITPEQQEYIQKGTKEMPILFGEVGNFFNKQSIKEVDMCKETSESKRFGLGYRTMCNFWFAEFLKYLENYEYILRIDDDCIVEKVNENFQFPPKEFTEFASIEWQWLDHPDVIVGMVDFVEKFAKNNSKPFNKDWNGPLTHIMLINIPWAKKSEKFIKAVENTDCIYSNRWGDLPLWGAALMLEGVGKKYIKGLKYHHGSWGVDFKEKFKYFFYDNYTGVF